MNGFALVLLPLMFGLVSTTASQCCSFDDAPGSGECGFLQQGTNDDHNFTLRDTYTTSSYTGPQGGPNARAPELDEFAYFETSWNQQGATAQLVITPPGTGSFTLDFAYNMYGSDMGSARVFETDVNGVTTDLWNKNGDQGDQWFTEQLTVSSNADSVTFEAVKGFDYRSDIAFDHICVGGGVCCDFDVAIGTGDCGFVQQGTNDGYDFIVATSTPSSNTGPQTGLVVDTGASDWYAYFETSSPVVQGETAQLVIAPVSESFALDFAYHMYGITMGSARVFETDGSGVTTDLWNKNGDQGDQWFANQVTVSSSAVSVTIEATRGSSFESDIAFDDICMTTNAVPTCPSTDYVEMDGNCYKFVTSPAIPRDAAATECANDGASLFEWTSVAELENIRQYIKADAALLLQKKYWVKGVKLADTVWYWGNGGAAINTTLILWGHAEPNNKGGNENCMNMLQLRDYYINDARCPKNMGYICKV